MPILNFRLLNKILLLSDLECLYSSQDVPDERYVSNNTVTNLIIFRALN